MAEREEKKPYIQLNGKQIDLMIGDMVELMSGGPVMTIIGHDNSDLKCAFFVKSGDDSFSELGVVYLPRAAVKQSKD